MKDEFIDLHERGGEKGKDVIAVRRSAVVAIRPYTHGCFVYLTAERFAPLMVTEDADYVKAKVLG